MISARALAPARGYAQVASVVTGGIAAIALLDWVSGGPGLMQRAIGLEPIRVIAALKFLFASVSLWLLADPAALARGRVRIARICAGAALALAALTLWDYIMPWQLGVDGLLIGQPGIVPAASVRPAPNGALALALISAALLWLDRPVRRHYAAAEWLALAAFAIGLLALLGYTYGVRRLYRIADFSAIPALTALMVCVMALGVLAARPGRGVMRSITDTGPAGLLLRRLLPTAVLAPIVLGWLFLAGQRARLYDAEFGFALLVAASVIVLGGLLLHTTLAVGRVDRARRDAQDSLRRTNEELEQRVAHRTNELTERNIALRREVDERQKAEEKFRTVVESALDAIVSADARGSIVHINPAAERIFGYAQADVHGHPLTVLMPERFHERHQHGFDHFLATHHARVIGRTVELVGRRRDGSEFPLELSLAAGVVDDEPYFTGVIRDITARRDAQQRIEQLNDSLLRRTQELEALNRELEAFSYSVSHDLRAPLRSIDGFSQALLEDYGAALDDAGRNHLQRVRAGAQRMGELIDDLLTLSRISRAEVNRQEVDLSAMAAAVGAELVQANPERDVALSVAPALGARCDGALVRIALTNLMNNAWKFTATRAQATVEFGVTGEGAARAYFVRDNGVGFDMDYSGQLFGAFQRLHAAHEFPGSGIGLATVQRVVHKHGGRIWADAAPDRGAAFYFTLPTEDQGATWTEK